MARKVSWIDEYAGAREGLALLVEACRNEKERTVFGERLMTALELIRGLALRSKSTRKALRTTKGDPLLRKQLAKALKTLGEFGNAAVALYGTPFALFLPRAESLKETLISYGTSVLWLQEKLRGHKPSLDLALALLIHNVTKATRAPRDRDVSLLLTAALIEIDGAEWTPERLKVWRSRNKGLLQQLRRVIDAHNRQVEKERRTAALRALREAAGL